MKKNLALLLGLLLSFPSLSQYSQNIDTLSREEIKEHILSLDVNHEARVYLKKSKTSKIVGGVLLVSGLGITFISISNLDRPDHHEINMQALTNAFLGAIISTVGIGTLIVSEIQFSKTKKVYKKSL